MNCVLLSQDSQSERIAKIIYMDSIEVTAENDISIQNLIELIINDTTFYEAFRRIKRSSLEMSIALTIFDRKNNPKDSAEYSFEQEVDGRCRWPKTFIQKETKGIRRKNKIRYYTSTLLESIFITRDTSCWNENALTSDRMTKTQRHISELKKLMFQPGEAVNVPFMGNKTAIFQQDMQKYYDYELAKVSNENTYWKFSANVKPEWSNRPNKTVIKNLEVIIDPHTHEILRKTYHLDYKTVAYQFDVYIDVALKKFENGYMPHFLSYNGKWNAATKKAEHAEFEIKIN